MKARLIGLFRRLSLGLSFIVLIAAFLFVILWNVMVHTIPVGHAGVLWHRIILLGGAVSKGPLGEGLHIILPWDKIYIYDLRLQVREQSYQVLSKDGLAFDVDLSFRWRVAGDHLVALNQNIGPDYVNSVMTQEIGSVTREVIALYTAEALFTGARTEVQQAIYDRVRERQLRLRPRVTEALIESGTRGGATLDRGDGYVILLSDILIKHVELPTRIAQAIQSKLEQAQVVEEYRFRVQREALESERKSVEADGIRKFQEIVTPAITESYLRWRGIEATLKLAQSPNSKVVVIGSSATGLPLILDTTTAAIAEDDAPRATEENEPNVSLNDGQQPDQGSLEDVRSQGEAPSDMRRSLP